jgi:hypothetical protein
VAKIVSMDYPLTENVPKFSMESSVFVKTLERIVPSETSVKLETSASSGRTKTILEGFDDIYRNIALVNGPILVKLDAVDLTIGQYQARISYKESRPPFVSTLLTELGHSVPWHLRVADFLSKFYISQILCALLLFSLIAEYITTTFDLLLTEGFFALLSIAFVTSLVFNSIRFFAVPRVFFSPNDSFFKRNKDQIIWTLGAYLAGNLTPDFSIIKSFLLAAIGANTP